MRKRDDLTGHLFRVAARRPGGEWEHTNYGHSGKPRTYTTIGAARAMRTAMRTSHQRYGHEPMEFRVESAPVLEWSGVPDKE